MKYFDELADLIDSLAAKMYHPVNPRELRILLDNVLEFTKEARIIKARLEEKEQSHHKAF